MKKVTKERIKNLEKAFNQGYPVYWFGRTSQDLRYYGWIRIKDISIIKKCVLGGYEIKVDYGNSR